MTSNDSGQRMSVLEDFSDTQANDMEIERHPPQNLRRQQNMEIPDGGVVAWTQVFCSWILFFNTFGLVNTFGIYQNYYASGVLFYASSSDISWIGSIQALAILFVGALTGPLYDAGHLRVLLIAGTFGIVFGHMMLSLCHEYWQVLLTQGIVIGLGGSCLFIPGIAVLPGYFSRHIGLAVGLAVSGSSFGGVVYPLVFYKLIGELSFAWSVRILGFMALFLLSIPVLLMRMRTKPPGRRALIDYSAFTDASFILFTTACMIGYAGLYVVVFYVSFYGENTGILSERLAFYIVPILNAASIFGRTVPNWLSDHYGPLNIMAPAAMIMSVLTFCFIVADTSGSLLALGALYGAFSGVFLSLPGVVMVSITKDKSRIGTRVGMSFCLIGIGILAGGPGGGAILGTHPTSSQWTDTWVYGGICAVASGFLLLALRFQRSGRNVFTKV